MVVAWQVSTEISPASLDWRGNSLDRAPDLWPVCDDVVDTHPVERIHVSATSEPGRDLAAPSSWDGYVLEPHERPEDWGWHQEFKVVPRVLGWLAVVSLLLMLVGNHSGRVENLWVIGTAVVIAAALIRDQVRRRNTWRN